MKLPNNSADDRTRNYLDDSTQISKDYAPKRVCPMGLPAWGSTGQMLDDTKSLLFARLRLAVVIMFLGFLAFWGRDVAFDLERPGDDSMLTWVCGGVTFLMAMFAALLWSGLCLSLRQLRVLELMVFGIPALFFAWIDFRFACWTCAQLHTGPMNGYFAQSSIAWIILINLYGLFIPNSWKRAATVTGVLALIPIVVAFIAGMQHEQIRSELHVQGGLSTMVLWLLISYVSAVYGSHKIGTLRREAVAAKQVGAYELKKLLGKGGMGEVHLAEHKFLKRPCAIKLIRPENAGDPKAVARFESEVQATAQLTHWNTIEIYDYGHSDDGTFYYAMEYLPGSNLQDLVDQYGPMCPARAVYLLRQVCQALREAHGVGLIHRDIKPGNIFAAQRGGVHDVAKLLDFGLVKSVSAPINKESMKLTMDGMVIGSPLYTAPEIVMGERAASPASDIYSFGAVAFFLVTGQPVFEAETPLKVVFAHVHDPVPVPSGIEANIPPDLEAIILRCLAKQPGERFENVMELEKALAQCECADQWSAEHAERWWQSRLSSEYGQLATDVGANATTTILQVQA